MKSRKNKNTGKLTRRSFLKTPAITALGTVLAWPEIVPSSVLAAKAGKDTFLQKPLTLTAAKGRVLSDTVRRYRRILQVGSQPPLLSATADKGAPRAEYTEKRVHPQDGYGRPGWLRISDYCCGMITGWSAHHIDIAQWAMATEYTGPTEVQGWAEYPREGLRDVHGKFRVECTYANGVKLICADNTKNKQGIVFEGTEGRVYVKRGLIDVQPKSLLTSVIDPTEIRLYKSNNHKQNFLECIRSQSQTVAPVEIDHRSNTVCILVYIAMLLGRKLKWDPEKEEFINDAQANRLLSRPMRSPWKL